MAVFFKFGMLAQEFWDLMFIQLSYQDLAFPPNTGWEAFVPFDCLKIWLDVTLGILMLRVYYALLYIGVHYPVSTGKLLN